MSKTASRAGAGAAASIPASAEGSGQMLIHASRCERPRPARGRVGVAQRELDVQMRQRPAGRLGDGAEQLTRAGGQRLRRCDPLQHDPVAAVAGQVGFERDAIVAT